VCVAWRTPVKARRRAGLLRSSPKHGTSGQKPACCQQAAFEHCLWIFDIGAPLPPGNATIGKNRGKKILQVGKCNCGRGELANVASDGEVAA